MDFFNKKDRLITIRIFFWIIPVQDFITSPANVVCPLGTLNYSNDLDIDFLCV